MKRKSLPAAIALLCAGALPVSQNVLAAPTGGQVVGGSGSIATPNATTTVVNQSSQNLAVDWESFNLDSNELVKFNQPSASAAVLNRIFDQNPSQIFGTIQANGHVLLMNPNGVIFGPGAQINVAGLVAASAHMNVDDFMNNNWQMTMGDGQVINRGTLTAATGGSVTLAGKTVKNEGLIVANYGRVNLASGNAMTLDFDGDGLIRFRIDEEVLDNPNNIEDAVHNTGTINADGGQVLMAGNAAKDVFTRVVNNEGMVRAGRIDTSGGVIRLVANGGDTFNSGTLDASAQTDNTDGGSVQVLGDRVALTGNAMIDASGQGVGNGGEVLVGGDFQGNNPDVKNAQATYVGADATITADAGTQGDGGKVIVWSDEQTDYQGHISATGGSESGNGGFAEVSGKQGLRFNGTADLSAENGDAGTLLLDPLNIEVVTGGAADLDGTPSDGNANIFAFTEDPASSETVDPGTITGILDGGTNVTLQAHNDITVTDAIDASGSTTPGGGLTLQAGDDILINAAITLDRGDLLLSAGDAGATPVAPDGTADITVNASLSTGGTSGTGKLTGGDITLTTSTGDISLNANLSTGNITSSDDSATSGDISVTTTTGSISGTGNLTTGNATAHGSGAGGAEDATAGSITLSASGDIQLSGTLTTGDAHQTNDAGGNETTTAGSINVTGNSFSSNGGTGQVAVALGAATNTNADSTLVQGTLSVTTTGGSGTGGIYVTSGSDLRLGALATNGGAANTVNIATTGGANLTLTDVAHTLSGDTATFNANSGTLTVDNGANDLNIGGGALTLRGDEIDLLGGADSVDGTGTLALEAGQAATTIGVFTGATGTLSIDSTDMAAIQDGFTSVTIGSASGSGAVVVSNTSDRVFDDHIIFANTGTLALGLASDTDKRLDFTDGVTATASSAITLYTDEIRSAGNQITIGDADTGVTLTVNAKIETENGVAAGAALNLGTITGASKNLTLNSGTTGAITVASNTSGVSISGVATLDIANSNGATFNGSVSATTVDISDTEDGATVLFKGDVSATTLTTTANAYNLQFDEDLTVTNDVTFADIGDLTIGSASDDVALFDGGLDTTGIAGGTITLNGAIRTSGDQIDLGAITIGSTTSIDSTNDGGTAAGGKIVLTGAVTGGSNSLTLNSGTNNVIDADNAAVTIDGTDLTIANSNGAIFGGIIGGTTPGALAITDTQAGKTIQFKDNVKLTSLSAAASGNAYDVQFDEDLTVTNDVTFGAMTGNLTIGNATDDIAIFTGGVDTSAIVGTVTLWGKVYTEGTQADFGAITMGDDLTIDTTYNGNTGGANLNLGAVTGSGFDLTLDAGTTGIAGLTNIGSSGNELTSLVTDAATADLNGTIYADSQAWNADITLSGASELVLSAGNTLTFGVGYTVDVKASTLTLTANDLAFDGGANSITASTGGSLVMQTVGTGDSIDIGYAAGTATLNIDDSHIAALDEGFTNITIGRSDGQHTIGIDSASFKDSVTIQTPLGGSITVDNQLDTLAGTSGVAGITLTGDGAGAGTDVTLNANLVAEGGAITINDDVVLQDGTTITLDTTGSGGVAAGAAVDLKGTVDGGGAGTSTLTITAGTAGAVTIEGAVGGTDPLVDLNITGGNVTTKGDVDITGTATLVAAGALVQSTGTTLTAPTVDLTGGTGGISDGAAGQYSIVSTSITATSGSGDILLLNTNNNPTTIVAMTTAGGSIDFDQAGTGAVTLKAGSGGIVTGFGGVNGGDVDLNIASGGLTVNEVITTATGTGGALTITSGGVTLNATPVLGAGNITLNGGTGSDIVISTDLTYTTAINFKAPGDIIIEAKLSGSDISLIADSDGDNSGGVLIHDNANTGEVIATGSVYIEGSDLITATGAPAGDSVYVDAWAGGNRISAAGDITIQSGANAPANADIYILGNVATTGGTASTVLLDAEGTGGAGTIYFGSTITTDGAAITFNNQTELTTSATLNTANAGSGGAITFNAALDGTAATDLLTIDAGTAGVVAFNGAVGGTQEFDLTITNSGSTTFAATTKLDTVTLTDTTGTIAFQGDTTIVTALATAAQPYGVSFTGTTNTVAGATTFLNTGTGSAVTLGNGTGDSIEFTGGLTATAPAVVNTAGTVQTSDAAITLGAVSLDDNTVIDTQGTAAASGINIGAVTGGGFDLTLDAGSNLANISGTSVAGAGTLTLQNALTASFTGNVAASTLTVTTNVDNLSLTGGGSITNDFNPTLAGNLILGDASTDSITFAGGLDDAGVTGATKLAGTIATTNTQMDLGAIWLDGVVGNVILDTGATGGTMNIGAVSSSGGANLSLDGGTGGVVTVASFSGTGATILEVVDSGSTTFTGDVTALAGTLKLSDTTGTIQVGGNLNVASLTTAAQGYNVELLGTLNNITNTVIFSNTGTVTLGNGTGDSFTFDGGLDSSSGPSMTHTAGSITSSDDALIFGPLTVDVNTIIKTNATTAAGDITLGAVTLGTNSLTLESGSGIAGANVVGTSVTGAAGSTLALDNIGGWAQFTGNITATNLTTTNTVNAIYLTGGGTITNAVNFNNTGVLQIGDTAGDVFTFTGGVDTTTAPAPSLVYTAGTIATGTNVNLSLGTIRLVADTTLNANGGALTVGGITGLAPADITLLSQGGATNTITTTAAIGGSGNVNAVTMKADASILLGGGIVTVGASNDVWLETTALNLNTQAINTSANNGDITFITDGYVNPGVINAGTGAFQISPFNTGAIIEFADWNSALIAENVFYQSTFPGITAGSFIIGQAGHTGDIYLSNEGSTGTGLGIAAFATDLSLQTAGTIHVSGDYNSVAANGSLTLNGGAGVTFQDLSADTTATLSLGSGAFDVTGAGTLTESLSVTATGGITFNSALDGVAPNTQNLTLTAGTTGDIVLTGAVGTGTRLGDIVVNSSNDFTANAITADSFYMPNAGGSSGTATFNGALNFNGDSAAIPGSVFRTNGIAGDIILNNTLTTTGGNFIWLSAIGSTSITANGDINTDGSIGIYGGTALSTAGDITTAGGYIDFTRPTTLTGNVVLDTGAGGGNVSFDSTLNGTAGTETLDITAGTGSVTFSSVVGGTKTLGDVTISSANNVTATTFTSTGLTQTAGVGTTTFNGAVATSGTTGVDITTTSITVNNTITTTGSGGVTLAGGGAGTTTIAAAGDISADGAVSISAGTGGISTAGNVTTTGDNISFNSATTLTGSIALSSGTGAGDVSFGSTLNASSANVQNLTLTAGTGNITMTGAVGGVTRLGDILVNSANNVTANAITADSFRQVEGSGTSKFDGVMNFNGGDAGFGYGFMFYDGGTGNMNSDVQINNTLTTTNSRPVYINTTGTVSIAAAGDISSDGSVYFYSQGGINTAGDVTTTNDLITFGYATTLTGDVALNTGTGAGNISFNNTLTATNAGLDDLTLTAGAGSITFTGAVGATRLGDIRVTTANNVAAAAITANSYQQDTATGTTTFNGALNFDGDTVSYAGYGMVITGAGTNNISLNNTLTTTTATGRVYLDANGTLNIAAAGDISANGSVDFYGTVINTAGDVTTTNDYIYYWSPTVLTGNVLLNTGTGAGDVLFNTTLNGTAGTETLGIAAGTGSVYFNGVVGGTKTLGDVTVSSANNVFATTFTATSLTQTAGTGKTTLNGAVTTSNATGVDITTDVIAINNTITTTTGNGVVSLSASGGTGTVSIAATGDISAGGAVDITGTGGISTAGNVTTTNDNISFNSATTLTGSIALNSGTGAGDISFGSTLNGSTASVQNLTMSAGTGNVTMTGAAGTGTRLGDVVVNSSTDFTANAITADSLYMPAGAGSTGTATFNGALNFSGNNAVYTSEAITLDGIVGDIVLNGSLVTTDATGGRVYLYSQSGGLSITAAGDINSSNTVYLNGSTGISTAGDVTTSNDTVTYATATTLTGNVVINTGTGTGGVTYSDTLNGSTGAETLDISTGTGDITFNGLVGNSQTLTDLTASGANITAWQNVNLTGTATLTATTLLRQATGTTLTAPTVVLTGGTRISDTAGTPAQYQISSTSITAEATGTGAAILLNNSQTGATDILSMKTKGGAIDYDQTGGGAVDIAAAGSGIDTGAAGTVNGGDVNINVDGGLTVSDVITTSKGTGGVLSIGGGVTLDAGVTLGAGDVTLNGGGLDIVINSNMTSSSTINLSAPQDIIVNALIQTTGTTGADINLTADSSNNGSGGVLINAAGQLISVDQVNITGSDLITATAATGADSIYVVADGGNTQIQASGDISLLSSAFAAGTADIYIDGIIDASAGTSGTVAINAADTTELGSNISADNGITFSDAVNLTAASTLTSTAGTISFTSTLDGGNDLTLTGGANTSFTGAVGGSTAVGDGNGAAITMNSTGTTAFNNTLTTASGITQANTAGTVTFTNNATIGAGNTATTLNGNVILDGLTFKSDGAVTLGNAGTDSVTLSGGAVTIETTGAGDTLTVNAAVSGAQDLTLNTADTATFVAAVGAIGDGTGASLIINSAGATDFQSTLTTSQGITQDDAAGTVTFRNNVTISNGDTATVMDGDVVLDGLLFSSAGAVTLGNAGTDSVTLSTGAVTLQTTGTGDTLTVNAAVDGGQNLILNTADTATFNGTVGATTAIGTGTGAAITINSSGATDFVSTVKTASGITQADAAGDVTFEGDVTIAAGTTDTTFNANVVLDGMTMTAGGNVTFGNAATDTLTTSTALATVDTSAANTTVDINSATTLGADLTVDAGSGLISLDGTINGGNNLTLNTTGITDINATIGGSTPVATVTTNAGGTTEIGANITSSGTQTYNDAVKLITSTTLSTGTGAGDISFGSTVNASTANVQALTLTAGTGDITFVGAVGTALLPMGDILINSAGNVTANAITADSFRQAKGSGTSQFNGAMSFTGSTAAYAGFGFMFYDPVSGMDSNVEINNTLTVSNNNYIYLANTGTLTIDAAGDISSDAGVYLYSQGGIDTAGDITTTNDLITFGYATTLTGNVLLNTGTGAGDVSFGSTLNGTTGGETLDITAGLGSATFGGVVGGTTSITDLTVAAKGGITFSSAATLAGAIALDTGTGAGNVNFGSTLDGATGGETWDITAGTGSVTFTGVVGGTQAVNDLTVSADGGITFSSAATLGGAASLDTGTGGGNVSFNSTLNGATGGETVDITAGTGNVTFTGAVGGVQSLTDITASGANITGNADITLTGIATLTATGSLVQATGTTLTAPTVNLDAGTGISDGAGTPSYYQISSTTIAADNTGASDVLLQNTNTGGATSITSLTTVGGNIDFRHYGDDGNADGSGALTVNGDVTSGDPGTSTDGGNITLWADDGLEIKALVSSQDVTVAGSTGGLSLGGGVTFSGTGSVDVGLGDITLNGGGQDIVIDSALNVTSAITFTAPRDIIVNKQVQTTSSITLAADDDGLGNGDGVGGVQINAGGQLLAGTTITVSGSDLFVNNTTTGKSETDSIEIVADGANNQIQAGGNITLQNSNYVTLNGGTAEIYVNGNIESTGAGAVYIDAPDRISLSADITTAGGNITFVDAVDMTSNVLLDTGAGAGTVAFNSTLAGTGGTETLGITAGSGNVDFDAAVSNLGAVTISSAANVTADSTVSVASLNQAAGSGTTWFKNTVTMTDGKASDLTVTTSSIQFDNAVTTTAGSGVVTLTGAGAGTVTIAALADINAGGAVSITSGTGGISTAGDVTTSDDNISFNSATTLTGSIALDSGTGGGDVSFGSTLNGSTANTQALDVSAGTGSVTFTGAVGTGVALGAVTINDAQDVTATTFTASSLTQSAGTGTTTLNGAVTTSTATGVNITTDVIAINNTITSTTGNGIVNLDASGGTGTVSIAATGDISAGGAVDISGTGGIDTAGNITTTNDNITFASDTVLTGTISLNTGTGAGAVEFQGTLDGTAGTESLSVAAGGGNVTFTDKVGDTQSLTSITASGVDIEAQADVTLTGTATLNASDELIQSGGTLTAPTVNLDAGAGGITDGTGTDPASDQYVIDANTIYADVTGGGVLLLYNNQAAAAATSIRSLTTVGGVIDYVQTGGGAVTITSGTGGGTGVYSGTGAVDGGDISIVTDGGLTVDNKISSQTNSGTYGTFTIGGGVALNASPDIGAGDITLNGGGQDFVLGAAVILSSPSSLTISVPRDIIIHGTVQTTGGTAALTLTADNDSGVASKGDSLGGVLISSTGSLISADGITITGADLNYATGLPAEDSVVTEAGSTIAANGGDLLIQSGGGAGGTADIYLGGTASSSGSTTVTSNDIIYLGNNISSGDGQTYNNAVELTAGVSLTNTGGTGTGITFTGTVDGAFALDINDDGTTTFTDKVGNGAALASLTIDSGTGTGGVTAINGGSVETTGNQQYFNAITLGADTTLDSGTGNVYLNNTVNGGGNKLTVNSAGITSFAGDVSNVSTLTTDAAGTTEIGGTTGVTISTTDGQTYGDAVVLTADSILNDSGATDITFSSTLNGSTGAETLELDSATGNVVFTGAVGAVTGLGSIDVNNAANVNFNSTVTSVGLVNVDNASDVTFSGAVSSVGNINLASVANVDFGSTVTSVGPIAVGSASGDVTFTGAVDTVTDITLTTVGGNVDFGSTVNSVGPISVGSATDVTFAGAVTTVGDITLTSVGNVDFNSTVSGAGAIAVGDATDVTFADTLSAASYDQSAGTGTTAFNGAVTTNTATGVQVTTNNIAVNNSITTTNSGVVILNGSGTVTLAAAGDIVSDGVVSITGVGGITTAADVTSTGDSITFVSATKLSDNIDIALDTTGGGAVPAGANVQFSSTLDGDNVDYEEGIIITAGSGNVTFAGAVGSNVKLKGMQIISANNVTAGGEITAQSIQINNAGAASVSGPITTTTSTQINAGSAALNDSVTASSLLINTSGATTVVGPITTTTSTQINAGSAALNNSVTANSLLINTSGATTVVGPITTTTSTQINAGSAALNDSVTANSLLINTSGATTVTGPIATSGTTTIYSGSTGLNGSVTASSLQIDTSGATTLNGAISTSGVSGVKVTSGSMTLNNAVTTTGGGTVSLSSTAGNTNITAAGDITSSGAVTISGSAGISTAGDVNASADNITYASTTTITGPMQISPNSAAGAVTFSALNTGTASPITVIADTINLNGAVTGSGDLVLQPFTNDANICIGTCASSATLNINSSVFSGFGGGLFIGGTIVDAGGNLVSSGFASALGGAPDQNPVGGAITIGGDLSLGGNIVLLAQQDITLSAKITGTGSDSTVTLATQGGDILSTIATTSIDAAAMNLVATEKIGTETDPIVVLIPTSTDAQFALEGPQAFINNDTGAGVSDAANSHDAIALAELIGLLPNLGAVATNTGSLFATAQVKSGLEDVGFVDVSLFEEDLEFFGRVDPGIRLPDTQSEDYLPPDILEDLLKQDEAEQGEDREECPEGEIKDAAGNCIPDPEKTRTGWNTLDRESYQGNKQQLVASTAHASASGDGDWSISMLFR